MKSISIKKQHKAKLLEMCQVLFPKVTWQFWVDESCEDTNETHIGYNKTFILGDKVYPYKDGLMMHWFEFVIIHLMPKILSSPVNVEEFFLYLNDQHPIDYLYTEFRKLK